MPESKRVVHRRDIYLFLLLVLLLAFGLRLYELTGHSLWSEEGLFLLRGAQPAGLTLAGEIETPGAVIPDNVGPLTPLLLNLFQAVVGSGQFAGRYFSLLLGVLAVAMLFPFGRLLVGRRVALGATFLLAISPYHVWVSREIGYESLLLLVSLLAAYAFLRLLFKAGDSRNRWFYLVMGIIGIVLVIATLPRRPVDPSLTFLFIPGRSFTLHAAGLLGTGLAPNLDQQWWRYLPALILAGAGILAGWRHKRKSGLILLVYLVLILIPLWVGDRQDVTANTIRLIFLSLPPFLLLVALGWLTPWKKWRGRALVLGIVMVAIQLWWLGQQYSAPELRKDDVRALATELTELARPGDAIVIQDLGTLAAFTEIYQGSAPWFLLPAHSAVDASAVAAELAALGQSADRVWLVTAPRPRTGFPTETLVEAAKQWPHLFSRTYDWLWLPLEVSLFVPRPESADLPAGLPPAGINWEGELILEGYSLPAQVTSGGLWQPSFIWRKTATAEGQYTLFLRLTDSAGKTWAVDDWLLWEDYPPGFWPAETFVHYEPVLRFPAGLPPGVYTATLQVVRTRDGQLLNHAGGTDLQLSPDLQVDVAMTPVEQEALPAYTGRHEPFNGELILRGFEVPTLVDYRPGHPIPVRLVWEAAQDIKEDYRLRLDLLDNHGEVVNSLETSPVKADYPPSQWPAGALLAATHDLLVPATAPEGRYTVHLSILPMEGNRPVQAGGLLGDERVLLTDVNVLSWPLQTEFPEIANPVYAEFGPTPAQILQGYALDPEQPAAGTPWQLTLYWRAGQPTQPGYTVLVHLTDMAGNLVAQGDGVPVNGIRPTTSWRPGEVLVDEHVVMLPETLPAGSYMVWVGFYDPETGQRLPVNAHDVAYPDDRFPLVELEID
jgi:hypothetical protein